MTIEQMRERKRELGYSYEQIAQLSGLPLGTVQKVLGGITQSPRYDTLQALEAVFTDKGDMLLREEDAVYGTEYLREAAAIYQTKRPGEYTIDDYMALPEDERVELIDGVFYEMAEPMTTHQAIGGEIFGALREFIRSNKGQCIPLSAPTDVQLDCDNKTVVQPDVLVVCDRDKFKYGRVFGAPDFVVEVLSPSTSKKDAVIKLGKYCNAGVREYWMVDPKKKRIFVYDFENDACPTVYTFDNEVPVSIFEGKCKVDFKEIYEYVGFLFEQEEK